MTPRVREILSWYQGDAPAALVRLAQILNHGRTGGSGKLLLAEVSDGIQRGPSDSYAMNPDSYHPAYHFRMAIEGRLSALIAPLGLLEAAIRDFAGEIPVLLKADHTVNL